jgi:hypothetical protein
MNEKPVCDLNAYSARRFRVMTDGNDDTLKRVWREIKCDSSLIYDRKRSLLSLADGAQVRRSEKACLVRLDMISQPA